jgi:hypothetical protein
VSKHAIAVDKGLSSADSADVLSASDFASLLSKARRKVDAKKGSFNASFSEHWRDLFAPAPAASARYFNINNKFAERMTAIFKSPCVRRRPRAPKPGIAHTAIPMVCRLAIRARVFQRA